MHRFAILPAFCLISLTYAAQADDAARSMLSLDVNGTRLEGMSLGRTASTVELLGREGRLLSVPSSQAKTRSSSKPFRSFTAMELREQLTRELGKAFEVSSTGHYLVAHPKGQRDLWSSRFEDLYRHFIHYFSVRGFRPTEPEFPLVAIVWPNQQQFLKYAAADSGKADPHVLGYYSPKTNRIALYDVGGGVKSDASWSQNADTIIHEATHQTAFNTGVHRRFAQTPRWVVEGLGTMFEAPGVWHSENYRRQEDRVNRGRLQDFQRYAKNWKPGAMADFIASDRMFETDPQRAYAYAWALSFFLVETQSKRYSDYLALTSRRPAFELYPGPKRVADFTSIFGDNFPLLEKRWLDFIAGIKS